MADLEEDFVGVGTRGTIGSLMCKELDYLRKIKHQQKMAGKLQHGTVSVFCEQTYSLNAYRLMRSQRPDGSATPPSCHVTEGGKNGTRSQRPRLVKCRSQGREMVNVSKKRVNGRKSVSDLEEGGNGYETPMLEQDCGSRKSGVSFVDVVDFKCTTNVYSYSHDNDKSWGITGIASRFMKRLSFSRLSV